MAPANGGLRTSSSVRSSSESLFPLQGRRKFDSPRTVSHGSHSPTRLSFVSTWRTWSGLAAEIVQTGPGSSAANFPSAMSRARPGARSPSPSNPSTSPSPKRPCRRRPAEFACLGQEWLELVMLRANTWGSSPRSAARHRDPPHRLHDQRDRIGQRSDLPDLQGLRGTSHEQATLRRIYMAIIPLDLTENARAAGLRTGRLR